MSSDFFQQTPPLLNIDNEYDRVVVLSGDGDFLPVLKYLKNQEKRVFILARGKKEAGTTP